MLRSGLLAPHSGERELAGRDPDPRQRGLPRKRNGPVEHRHHIHLCIRHWSRAKQGRSRAYWDGVMQARTRFGARSTSPATSLDPFATSPTTASRSAPRLQAVQLVTRTQGCGEHAVDRPRRPLRCHRSLRRRAHPALVQRRRPAAAGLVCRTALTACHSGRSQTSRPWPSTPTLWSRRSTAGPGRRARLAGTCCSRH